MTDPLRVPEAVREAVRARPCCAKHGESYQATSVAGCAACDDAIARAVLTAALKAEWEGPFRVRRMDGAWEVWRYEKGKPDYPTPGAWTKAEARCVAAALNITQGGERE